jgi:hypothetical protein
MAELRAGAVAERHYRWEPRGDFVDLGWTRVPEAVVMDGEGLRGAPDLHMKFWIRDEIPEVYEFTLKAREGGRGVRTVDLRGFSLEKMAVEAFMRMQARVVGVPYSEEEHWRALDDIRGAQEKQGTRPRVSRAALEEVAQVYRGAGRDNPTEAVRVELGYSRRTAERRVAQARKAGLLPAAKRGRP